MKASMCSLSCLTEVKDAPRSDWPCRIENQGFDLVEPGCPRRMMDVSRHRSVDIFRGYVRDAELFRDHAGTGLL